MNLSQNLRLVLFGSLYLAQGAVMSFIVTFNILYLGDAGYGPAVVGIFQAVLLIPFILKIFIGMLSDAVSLFGLGHRKPYILIGLVGTAVVIFEVPYIPIAESLTIYAAVLFLGATSIALYDTCTDGLALDTTPENERGLVEGVMTGARAAGILILLTIGGWLVSAQGWSWYFLGVAVLTILPRPLVLMTKEDPSKTQRRPSH
jgi:PAT family beta-lactamase induction signal transducer AmpG